MHAQKFSRFYNSRVKLDIVLCLRNLATLVDASSAPLTEAIILSEGQD